MKTPKSDLTVRNQV